MESRKKTCFCGKPVHAKDRCVTHYQSEDERIIRKYAPRRSGLIVRAGLRLTAGAVGKLERAEVVAGLSSRAAAAEVVNHWSRKVLWDPRHSGGPGPSSGPGRGWKATIRAAGAALVGLAVALSCASGDYGLRGMAEAAGLVKPMPDGPLPGQIRPPCEEGMTEIHKGCWLAVFDPKTRAQKRGCLKSTAMYEDGDGYCWGPAYPKRPKPEVPNAVEEGLGTSTVVSPENASIYLTDPPTLPASPSATR